MPVKLGRNDISKLLRQSITQSMKSLPARVPLGTANRWLADLFWNANAAMLNEMVDSLALGEMSRTAAIIAVAAALHISERQLYRRLKPKRAATH